MKQEEASHIPIIGDSVRNGRRIRAVAWQAEPGSGLDDGDLERIEAQKPNLVVLPEYFWVQPTDPTIKSASAHFEEDRERLGEISRRSGAVWVGGTLVEPADHGMVFNTCFVFERGREVARYRKRWLMPGEERAGVTAGREPIVVDVRGFRLGLMICADVLHEESYLEMASLRPEIICVPTNSPFRPEDPIAEKLERDQTYFVEGARRSGAWVVKACTVGRIFGRPVQGRSLVAGPRGVVARVPYDREGKACLLTADLEVQRGR